MRAVLILLMIGLLFGCAETPKKVIQLESSKVIPLSGKAILFNKAHK
jgi:hypothetical protein